MSRRWLVTGAHGMLGQDLVGALRVSAGTVTAMTRSDLDITDAEAVRDAVRGHDVVVNAAAWTDVDSAETFYRQAELVNATGPANLAVACEASGALLVQVSTDYVFDGSAHTPYREDAPAAPLNAYGRTKLAGEVAVRRRLPGSSLVVRTSWLYGAHGRSFVSTMARLAGERDEVDVVDDQRGQPTWTGDLAHRLVELVDAGAPAGTYHASSSGSATWFQLARAVFEELGLDSGRVRPVCSHAFRRPARRPAYTVLGSDACARIGLAPMRGWREALSAAAPVLLHQPARPA